MNQKVVLIPILLIIFVRRFNSKGKACILKQNFGKETIH